MPNPSPCPAQTLRRLVFVCLILLLSACGVRREPPAAATAAAAAQDYVVLVSIDGFRADYLDRGVTPRLAALAAAGVRADALRPAFPSLTFPNHYTLVTGLYPDHHGIVHNRIDGEAGRPNFVYNRAETTADPRWWGGEPIWVGAERQGLRSATMYWPGSDAAIGGVRPSYWKPFDREVTPEQRVDTVLGWLDLTTAQRPRFMTLYFEQVDRAGHDYGPDSAELATTLTQIDTALGRLVDGLARRGLDDKVNLVIVSDHGLTASDIRRTVLVDRIVDLQRVRAVNFGVVAGFMPQPGQQRYAEATLLQPHEHMQCWRRQQIPARLRYGSNARIPPIVCLAEDGWMITRTEWLRDNAAEFPRGEHGYDNTMPDMRALFVAHGPAFRAGLRVPEFDNVDVYPLLAHLLRIRPAPNDGNLQTTRGMLRE